MSLTFPVEAKLKDSFSVQLVLADDRDVELLRWLYRVIVEEGTSNNNWFRIKEGERNRPPWHYLKPQGAGRVRK
jgi:hypothetical protein